MINKPDTSKNIDYRYGIFYCINKKYSRDGRYWTNNQIKRWCVKRDISYNDTDTREDLVDRIKAAGYK